MHSAGTANRIMALVGDRANGNILENKQVNTQTQVGRNLVKSNEQGTGKRKPGRAQTRIREASLRQWQRRREGSGNWEEWLKQRKTVTTDMKLRDACSLEEKLYRQTR